MKKELCAFYYPLSVQFKSIISNKSLKINSLSAAISGFFCGVLFAVSRAVLYCYKSYSDLKSCIQKGIHLMIINIP